MRGSSPFAVVDLHASQFEIHDFALELEGLRERIRGDNGTWRHGHG